MKAQILVQEDDNGDYIVFTGTKLVKISQDTPSVFKLERLLRGIYVIAEFGENVSIKKNNKKMTDDEVLWLLKTMDRTTPTKIGLAMGKDYNQASAYSLRIMKRLEEKGLVYKTEDKQWKVKQ